MRKQPSFKSYIHQIDDVMSSNTKRQMDLTDPDKRKQQFSMFGAGFGSVDASADSYYEDPFQADISFDDFDDFDDDFSSFDDYDKFDNYDDFDYQEDDWGGFDFDDDFDSIDDEEPEPSAYGYNYGFDSESRSDARKDTSDQLSFNPSGSEEQEEGEPEDEGGLNLGPENKQKSSDDKQRFGDFNKQQDNQTDQQDDQNKQQIASGGGITAYRLDNEQGEDEQEDPDRQGIIRNVKDAHLVYKRQNEEGTYDELWIFNVTDDINDEIKIRRAILAGTDIPENKTQSKDKTQSSALTTMGNAQLLHITGLPN